MNHGDAADQDNAALLNTTERIADAQIAAYREFGRAVKDEMTFIN